MENASKALYIAGSLLIALLVISLLVYTFNNLGGVEEQKDEIAYEESITAFNREYEAFNKKIMYGVDVISCINKAVSNNEKYVKSGTWASGGASGEEAVVDVQVILNNDLKEFFKIYHMNDKFADSKYAKEAAIYATSSEEVYKDFKAKGYLNNSVYEFFKESPDFLSSKELDDMKIRDLFNANDGQNRFTNASPEYTLNLPEVTFTKQVGEYSREYKGKFFMDLMEESRKKHKFTEGTEGLKNLVNHASELEIVRINDSSDSSVWSSVKWTTVLSDFKKRKFECKEITYNENTGRVENILFVEK